MRLEQHILNGSIFFPKNNREAHESLGGFNEIVESRQVTVVRLHPDEIFRSWSRLGNSLLVEPKILCLFIKDHIHFY